MILNDDLISHYRPNIGILVFSPTGKIWLGRRLAGFEAADPETYVDGYRWQMPQGGIDKGEAIEDAAFRELREETGMTSVELLMITPGWLAYNFPPEYAKRKWRGQRQKWAIMRFTGQKDEINLTADDHQEFDAWRWAYLEEAMDLIVPFKRHVYEELTHAILPLRNWIIQQN